MMESKNIRVIDLGVDVSPRRFLEEAVGSHAQIVCLSGIMPHSEEDMRAVVEEFEMKGIRNQFILWWAVISLQRNRRKKLEQTVIRRMHVTAQRRPVVI